MCERATRFALVAARPLRRTSKTESRAPDSRLGCRAVEQSAPWSFVAHQILRAMQAQPKTIADYKKALARLGVPLPAGTTKKADYEALWLSAATKQKAASPPLKPRFVNPNVPLSMQEANLRGAKCPSTFKEPPSTPATPAFEMPEYSFASAPVEDTSSSPPQVMDDHWLPAAPSAEVPRADEARTLQMESPKPRSRVHSSRNGATATSSPWLVLLAALLVALGGGGYWMMPQCNLETGVNEPVAFITVETTEEAADFIAPVVADNETIAEAVPVAAAEEAAEEAAVEAAEDKAQNKAEDRTEKAAEDKIEDKAEDKAKDKSAIDLAVDDERGGHRTARSRGRADPRERGPRCERRGHRTARSRGCADPRERRPR